MPGFIRMQQAGGISRKKLAAAVVAGVALLLFAVGSWLRLPWVAAAGGLMAAALVALLIAMTFRRAGHLIVQLREGEERVRQDLVGLANEQARMADEMQRVALADFRELMLSAYREVFDALQEVSSSVDRLAGEQERTARTVARIEAVSGVLDAGVAATVRQLQEVAANQKAHTLKAKNAMRTLATTLDEQVAVPLRQVNSAINTGQLRYPLLNDIGSMLRLQQRFNPVVAWPRTTGWAMDSSTLERLVERILEQRPRTIVECGSGPSTVWLAYAAREAGSRLVSLEHLEQFARQTRQELARHGLQDVAEVRLAPLQEHDVEGASYRWYDAEACQDLDGIDMLLVDGPPKATGERARYPAVPLLRSRFSAHCTIIVDDVHRKQEQEIIDLWRSSNPGMESPQLLGDRTMLIEWQRTAGV